MILDVIQWTRHGIPYLIQQWLNGRNERIVNDQCNILILMKESVFLEYRMNGMMINSSTTEDDDYVNWWLLCSNVMVLYIID